MYVVVSLVLLKQGQPFVLIGHLFSELITVTVTVVLRSGHVGTTIQSIGATSLNK